MNKFEWNKSSLRTARVLVVCLLFVFMNVGPIQKQVLFPEQSYSRIERRLLRPWQMFTVNSRRICKVRYVQRGEGGVEQEINIRKFFRIPDHKPVPKKLTKIRRHSDALKLGKKLCKPDFIDVRLYSKCAKRDWGWQTRSRGEVNLCQS